MIEISIAGPLLDRARECEVILRSLPEWFGIEESIVDYVREIKSLPTFVALHDDQVIGFISLKVHFDRSAEMYVLGLLSEYHRQGIGRRLVDAAEVFLRRTEVAFLQVKTLSGSHSSEHYARTRRFYESVGFEPLEEFETLWGERNPCLLMVKSLRS